MTQLISDKLAALRLKMSQLELDAYIIPSTDEYLGEYIPKQNRRLQWVSEFTGSAGMVIVLKDSAVIFTDGRYTVQVRQQVSDIEFNFLHLVDNPQPVWLTNKLQAGNRVGFDARMHTYKWYKDINKVLADADIGLVSIDNNLVDQCWQDRPSPAVKPALLMDEKWSGKGSRKKRQEIGSLIRESKADAALLFAADSSNWLLNIRGQDIPSLPLILGFGILYADGRMIFHVNKDKLIANIHDHVGPNVEFLPESDFQQTLASFAGQTVLTDPETANAFSIIELEKSGARIIHEQDPVLLAKAAKSEIEISGMQEAHVQDAIAEIEFLCWFDGEIASGNRPDEAFLADKLLTFRQQQPDFVEVSFDTISAAGSNAAMCHYNHRNGTPANLPQDGVYLVDSGGQYHCGTTDITRTLAVGSPDDEIKDRFTLVLKGHIALDQIKFPAGTTGSQLDILARQPLWMQGLDYDHGTGHGVGHFLSVHEGPQRIGKKGNDVALLPGMVLSNEPGYYKDDAYGIRCENLVVVREAEKFGQDNKIFLKFEVLTFVPFDVKLINKDMLTNQEKSWINEYHQQVLHKIGPRLDKTTRQWLESATQSL